MEAIKNRKTLPEIADVNHVNPTRMTRWNPALPSADIGDVAHRYRIRCNGSWIGLMID